MSFLILMAAANARRKQREEEEEEAIEQRQEEIKIENYIKEMGITVKTEVTYPTIIYTFVPLKYYIKKYLFNAHSKRLKLAETEGKLVKIKVKDFSETVYPNKTSEDIEKETLLKSYQVSDNLILEDTQKKGRLYYSKSYWYKGKNLHIYSPTLSTMQNAVKIIDLINK